MRDRVEHALYRFFDLVVASHVNLGGPHADATAVDCVFRVHDSPMRVPDACDWSLLYQTPSPWLWVARDADGLLIRIRELAEFRVAADGSHVDCHPLVALPSESVSHLFVDQILPLLLSHQGKTVLHASAVSTPYGVVAFLGGSGVGKSTLAASFSVSGQPALTDDCLLVEEVDGVWSGHLSYGELHLWPDIVALLCGAEDETAPLAHYTDKRRVRPTSRRHGSANRAEPLLAVYHLTDAPDVTDGDHVRIRRASKRSAFSYLISNAFRVDFSAARAEHELKTLTHLAATIPVSTLSYARSVQVLPAVRHAVLSDARSVTAGGGEPIVGSGHYTS